jgi:hypothetical protein
MFKKHKCAGIKKISGIMWFCSCVSPEVETDLVALLAEKETNNV